jgi:hypothetical protein
MIVFYVMKHAVLVWGMEVRYNQNENIFVLYINIILFIFYLITLNQVDYCLNRIDSLQIIELKYPNILFNCILPNLIKNTPFYPLIQINQDKIRKLKVNKYYYILDQHRD